MQAPLATPSNAPTWQCVMVCWGTKYPVGLINHLMAQIARFAHREPRFVLITDRDHEGLRHQGGCRVCTVKAGGRSVAACTQPAFKGQGGAIWTGHHPCH